MNIDTYINLALEWIRKAHWRAIATRVTQVGHTGTETSHGVEMSQVQCWIGCSKIYF